MNDARLNIYLNDHMALMTGEVNLSRRCESSNRGTPLALFLHRLGDEVAAQRDVVGDLIRRLRGSESRLKQVAARLMERLGRLKCNDSLFAYSDLSRLIELETLTAAAQERVSLWDTLDAAAGQDDRFFNITFPSLREQSQEHLEELCQRRRDAAITAFPPTVKIAVRHRAG